MTDFYFDAATGLSLDFGGLQKPLDVTGDLAMLQKALEDMQALEGGAIANPDEQRMVGHYWLRAPKLAPTPEIAQEIEQVQAAIWQFAEQVHAGQIVGCKGQPFRNGGHWRQQPGAGVCFRGFAKPGRPAALVLH